MLLVMPGALILNIKREAIILPILYTWLCFISVCSGWGDGHPSAWLNVSMQSCFVNRSWLPNCTNEERP